MVYEEGVCFKCKAKIPVGIVCSKCAEMEEQESIREQEYEEERIMESEC
jgi:hypothetical protein